MFDGYNATWTDQSATFRYICDGFSSFARFGFAAPQYAGTDQSLATICHGEPQRHHVCLACLGEVLFTAVAQGMCYTGVEPGILVEGGAWRGQGVDYRPQVRRFVSTDAGDITQLSQPSFESLADASALRCPCNLRYPCNTMVLRLTVSDPKKGS